MPPRVERPRHSPAPPRRRAAVARPRRSPLALVAVLLAALVLAATTAGPGDAAADGPDPLRVAGPRQDPFFCETHEFRTADGSMLPAAEAPDCEVPTEVDYVYQDDDGWFVPLPDGETRPKDLVWTRLDGRRVPMIARVETGVVDRGIYELAMLDDPADDVEPGPTTRSPGWNRRLVYSFGGGCRSGWYVQGRSTGWVTIPTMLERGFAVASSSLNVFGHNCDDLLSAEVMAMTKRRFVERFGEPRWTIGWGCSGGSYQGHQIADNYPGLLDGVVAGCSFPDVGFGTSQMLFDSRVLHHWFDEVAPGAFTDEQRTAVSGFAVPAALPSMSSGAARLDPDAEFDPSVPAGVRYDAEANPTGARGTIWDHAVNSYGVDPGTGFARQPTDNVGVEYGLQAWRDGTITAEQFLDLNEGVGGLDADANHVPERSAADPVARHNAHATGRLLWGGNGLGDVPLIDYRAYLDRASYGDIHMRYQGFSTRARLEAANGDADNQVMLVEDGSRGLFDVTSPVLVYALEAMDRWIARVQRDDGPGSQHDRVVRARPVDLVDSCWTPGGERIREQQVWQGDTRCNALYPSHASPRIVAGGPLASDVISCHLADPVRAEHPSTTDAQWERLQEVFPDGVCDFSRPGVHQAPPDGTWLRFSAPGEWIVGQQP